MTSRKSRADYLRERLKRYGMRMVKSRRKKYFDQSDRGLYSVTKDGVVLLGRFHDATLEDVENLLNEKAAEFKVIRENLDGE